LAIALALSGLALLVLAGRRRRRVDTAAERSRTRGTAELDVTTGWAVSSRCLEDGKLNREVKR
jgi:hypothetical protein